MSVNNFNIFSCGKKNRHNGPLGDETEGLTCRTFLKVKESFLLPCSPNMTVSR